MIFIFTFVTTIPPPDVPGTGAGPAVHAEGLRALHSVPPWLHSVGDDGYSQGAELLGTSPERKTATTLLRESESKHLIAAFSARASLIYSTRED